MGELGVLFNPGMRHEQEEKLAKQMLREDEGTGRKGRQGIDLESGVVVIGADRAVPPAEPPEDSSADDPDRSTPAATGTADGRSADRGNNGAPAAAPRRRRSETPSAARPVGKARRFPR